MRPQTLAELLRILQAMGPARWRSASEIAAEDTCGLSKPQIIRALLGPGEPYVEWKECRTTRGLRTYTITHWRTKPGALETLRQVAVRT